LVDGPSPKLSQKAGTAPGDEAKTHPDDPAEGTVVGGVVVGGVVVGGVVVGGVLVGGVSCLEHATSPVRHPVCCQTRWPVEHPRFIDSPLLSMNPEDAPTPPVTISKTVAAVMAKTVMGAKLRNAFRDAFNVVPPSKESSRVGSRVARRTGDHT
jgi:hypothetical protein